MTTQPGTVRAATAADAADCARIYAHYVQHTSVSFETDPPSVETLAARIADYSASHAWLVLERSGRVAGYAYGHRFAERAAYSWSCETSIYLDPEHRSSGGGRALYQTLLPRLAERGYRRVYAGITLPNPASVGFHQAMGFRQVGVLERVGWKLGNWHDVAWLQRDLHDGDDGAPPDPPR